MGWLPRNPAAEAHRASWLESTRLRASQGPETPAHSRTWQQATTQGKDKPLQINFWSENAHIQARYRTASTALSSTESGSPVIIDGRPKVHDTAWLVNSALEGAKKAAMRANDRLLSRIEKPQQRVRSPIPAQRQTIEEPQVGHGYRSQNETTGTESLQSRISKRTYHGQVPGATNRGGQRSAVEVTFPFTGLWLVQNSPARRVPSHGTELFGEKYAIDFVGVDDRHRSSPIRDWRTTFSKEPPERFVGFGRPLLAPVAGQVAGVHDGEPDHEARRSQLALIPYAFGQASRIRQGIGAIAGNHVVISVSEGLHVALVHLKRGSIRVSPGQRVDKGQHLADCGNSGNSTEPHVHLQVMDQADPSSAQGVPMVFDRFREWRRDAPGFVDRQIGIPVEGSVIEPFPFDV
jgi:murein DD-endopeptidase MepM/ murein hydrolase activator NlpD